jgi:hypothetical protein
MKLKSKSLKKSPQSTKNIILRLIIPVIFLLLISNLTASVIITEIVPNDSSSDWIEFYVTENGVSLKNYKLYEGASIRKIFPDITLNQGDYFILNFNKPNTPDETTKGDKGYYNFYTSSTDLTGTDNVIFLEDSNANIIDGMCFANNNTSFTGNLSKFTALVSASQWTGTLPASKPTTEIDCVLWTDLTNKSFSRKYDSQNLPIDTNSKNDWQVLDLTKGKKNVIETTPTIPEPDIPETNLKILITEAMPDNGSDDWIEFFVAEGSGSIKNFEIKEGNSIVKTFPDIEMKTGDYFVLNFDKQTLTDETSKGDKGYYNFYTSSSGLTATDNTLTLKNEKGRYLDALCWSNNDETWSTINENLFNTLLSTGHWTATSSTQTECFVWTQTKVKSISRKFDTQNLPIDTNSKNDWQVLDLTKGKKNVIEITPNPEPTVPITPDPNPITSTDNNLKILITETMPDNGDDDWIEFFVVEGNGSIKNFELKAGSSIAKIFPDITVQTGDYFVLNFGKTDLSDETNKGDKNYFNFYTSDSGLTATDNILILKNSAGKYLDALCWSNNDGTWTATNKNLFDTLVSSGQWIANNSSETECLIWTPTDEKSISRKYTETGLPIDTNQKDDWELSKITKGIAKEIIVDDFENSFDFKILNTHFSPYGDYKNKTIKIKYKNKQDMSLKAKIYDLNLHLVCNLIDTSEEKIEVVEWNGKNTDGNILPVGVYIIYYEFIDKTKGLLKKGKKPVVLGKIL